MTKSKVFKIFLFMLVAVFTIGICVAFAACGDSETTDGGTTDGGTTDGGTTDGGTTQTTVVLSTTFYAAYGCTMDLTFYSDYTVVAEVDGFPSLNGTYEWAYTNNDNTEITLYSFGEGEPDWVFELLYYADELVALYITSDSPMTDLDGPFVAYPDGITAALQTADAVMGYTGNVIVMYDDGTLNYYWSSSTFPANYSISDTTLTFPVNGSDVTGTLTFDQAGKISGLTIGSILGSENVEFGKYGFVTVGDSGEKDVEDEDEDEEAEVIGDLMATQNPSIMGISAPCELIFYDKGKMTLNFYSGGLTTYVDDLSYDGTYSIDGTTITVEAGSYTGENASTGTVTMDNNTITQIVFTTFCGGNSGATFTTKVATVTGDLTCTTTMTVYGSTATPQIIFYNDRTMSFVFGAMSPFAGTYTIAYDSTSTFYILTFTAGMFSNISGTVTLDTDGTITALTNADFGTYGTFTFSTTTSSN